MAEGEFQSGQGGMATVPQGQQEDSYPTGNGVKEADSTSAPQGHIPWRTGAVKTKYPVTQETLGTHYGSVEPIARETRKTN